MSTMRSLSRRRFLQISAATFGAAAAAPWLPRSGAASEAVAGAKGVVTVPTFCEMCFWRCAGIASVRDGKLWKFEGNPLDPLSNGRLCPRGTAAVGSHYDPDRLREPLIRVGSRGAEQWKRASWDEALGVVAERLQKLESEHGPESLAVFNHGIGQRFFQHVLKSWGAINFAGSSFAQCRGPRDVGFALTFGTGVGSPEPTDIANTDCLVLIGTHLGENMHNTQVQEFAQAVGRRIPIIVVDPRFSTAASKATHWLPIRPGTDLALVLAWMNAIVAEDRHDKAFVERYGHGFDKFAAAIAPCTPEWAENETGIAAGTIRETAREIARHRPASIVHPGRRVVWYGDDTQRSRAIALLNALLGNWGRKGGLFVPTPMKIAGYPLPKYPETTRPMADNPNGERYPFADEAVTTGLRDATLTGKPYPVKGWFVYSSNLLHALPNEAETLKAIDGLDLLVVVDTMPSEIAGYADVVLPEAMFLERHDELLIGSGWRPWISLRQPVVAAPANQKPGWWIAKRLAEKLGVGACMPFDHIEQYLRHRVEKSALSYEALARDGVILGNGEPVCVEDGLELAFDTPSGKVEFWSDQLAAKGFDAVPKYRPPAHAPDGLFRLITGRAPVHTFSRTQNNPLLAELMPANEVWVNATTAAKLGLSNGAFVKLRNQDGVVSERVKVKATQRIRPDTVYMVYGFGHTAKGMRRAYRAGASAAQLNTRYETDPLMGGTSLHANFVAFLKDA